MACKELQLLYYLGAHNTIVCTRAGKDLVSSLASGLLTIGDRFGGALDGAAKQFTEGMIVSRGGFDVFAASNQFSSNNTKLI